MQKGDTLHGLTPLLAMLLVFFVNLTPIASEKSPNKETHYLGSSDNDLLCHVLVADIEYAVTEESHLDFNNTNFDFEYRCIPVRSQELVEPGITYALQLPKAFIERHEDLLHNGDTYVSITNATLFWTDDDGANSDAEVLMDAGSDIKVVPKPDSDDRRLGTRKKIGISSLLVLRVSSIDSTPTLTKAQLSERYFGIGGNKDSVNFRNQMKQCSFGQLLFEPALNDEHTGILDGVADIFINTTVEGNSPLALDDVITIEVNRLFGSSDNFDHIAYVLPPGSEVKSSKNWLAYAYIGWYRSVFNDKWSGTISTQMHEIGHNLGLKHSGEGSKNYGDQSGYMGYSYFSSKWPQMCYNGAKNWQLGWYENRSAKIDLSEGAWGGTLAAFVDYDLAPLDVFVVLSVGDMYIQYNRAKKFNHQTVAKRDQITITEVVGTNKQSHAIGSIASDTNGASSSYIYPAFQNNTSLWIEVCKQGFDGDLDFAEMSIYLDDGIQQSTCSSSPPSDLPSLPPSTVPSTSTAPSLHPTALPTHLPTLSLEPTFTLEPTSAPTYPVVSYQVVDACPAGGIIPEEARPSDEKAYVTCCKDGGSAERDVKGCSGLLTYDDAIIFCQEIGYRMCTKEEVHWGCGTGCLYDFQLVWTGTAVVSSTAAPTTDSPSSLPSTTPETMIPSTVAPTTNLPSGLPSAVPSITPSYTPSVTPTRITAEPSASPFRTTISPSIDSSIPTSTPVLDAPEYSDPPSLPLTEKESLPSVAPESAYPTPSTVPSAWPSSPSFVNPTVSPSISIVAQSVSPTDNPATGPSSLPSSLRSENPTNTPSTLPSTMPSTYPSLIPMESNSPSMDPTGSPSVSICEDSKKKTFFVDAKRGNKTCIWLARNAKWLSKLCVPEHDAYDICPELCSKCEDNCHDSVSLEFWTNKVQGFRDCKWLSFRPGWQEKICHPSHEAFHYCKETCDSCHPLPSATPSGFPSETPSEAPSFGDCDDIQDKKFFVEGVKGYRNCIWLNKWPFWKPILCQPNHDAYDICEESCGKCADTCRDAEGVWGEFWVNKKQGWKSCDWLAVRPGWQKNLCREGYDAFENCKETCDNCDLR